MLVKNAISVCVLLHCLPSAALTSGNSQKGYLKVSAATSNIDGDDEMRHSSVWVNGHARSGTSTMLSMISAADWTPGWRKPNTGDVFALFEPCQSQDRYTKDLSLKSCEDILARIMYCHFDGIEYLKGWDNHHSNKPGVDKDKLYDADVASQSCNKSTIVALKTINIALREHSVSKMFSSVPKAFVIDVVRDPRGVYASDKREFQGGATNLTKLYTICDYMKDNREPKDTEHKGLLRVRFEDMVTKPEATMRKVYKLIGINFEDRHRQWIQENFDASDCSGMKNAGGPSYSDCHTNSNEATWSWREELTTEEKSAFREHQSCRSVAQIYDYALG